MNYQRLKLLASCFNYLVSDLFQVIQCVKCGHADHADVNASFNIGNQVSYCAFDHIIKNMSRLHEERDSCKGSTDTPQAAILKMTETVEPLML